MGAYLRVLLKDKSEKNINTANNLLKKLGVEMENHNGVLYGLFTSQAMMEEDARFMNEDAEGLKQMPHWQRPVTVEMLSNSFYEIGAFIIKISGGTNEWEGKTLKIFNDFMNTPFAKKSIDKKNSEYLERLPFFATNN